jgi:hypothetical protein
LFALRDILAVRAEGLADQFAETPPTVPILIDREICVQLLERHLDAYPGTVVAATHDRWFLDRVATHILALEGGSKWFWFEGNFADYETNKIDRLGAEGASPYRVTYRRLTRGLAPEGRI